jgi:RNA polymerase sigma factor (sigma-70 family)
MGATQSSRRIHVAEVYEDLRPLLFSIAYRMLGSVAEAEDVVQEAFLRYQRALADTTAVESEKAYLSAVTTRLAIDQLRSARVRRESYVGEWMPEPLLTDESAPDAARQVEDADSLSMAFLLLLERLSPVERAVFLLHDVFDYGYDEIAGIVGKSEANCRQLAVRARRHIDEHKPRFEVSRRQREVSPGGSSTRSATATWSRCSSSSPPTSWSTGTAAGRGRPGDSRSSAASASSGSCSGWAGRRESSA